VAPQCSRSLPGPEARAPAGRSGPAFGTPPRRDRVRRARACAHAQAAGAGLTPSWSAAGGAGV